MTDRSERILVASQSWRTRARAGFDELKRGAQARCASEVGCSEALITNLLAGKIAASEYVGPISDWLSRNGVEMPRPQVAVTQEREVLLLDAASTLDDDRFNQVLHLARLLRR